MVSTSEYFCCHAVYFHFSDSHVYGGTKDRPDGKTVTAERVESRKQPEEFVISAEDLSNPFSVFGKQRTTATAAAEATPKMLEEERRTNK